MAEETKKESSNKSEVGSTSSKEKKDDKTKEGNKEKKDEKQRIKKINVDISDEVMAAIDEVCKNIKENESSSKIAEKLYNMLEKKFKKGWCVFVGKHYYGLVVHEQKTCAEFEIDDQRVSIFKCYVPDGA